MDNNTSASRNEHIFGPLKFPDTSTKTSSKLFAFNEECSVVCVLCELSFELPSHKNQFLIHLLGNHKLIIADIDNIACLKSYVDYWRTRFLTRPMQCFCSTFLCSTDSGGDNKEEYYLLSDVTLEDKLLREGLQKKRLEWILDVQAKERETPISRSCILCRLEFEGTRTDYFSHLYEKHHLHLGSPDNLVFTDELLDVIENMMERLQCIFCEGYFKERNILKEHMRKKHHKRINPNIKFYDRFYIVNYLEMGKTWLDVQEETDDTDAFDEVSDWSDWEDDIEPHVVCLYCDEGKLCFEDILEHMHKVHGFHYHERCNSLDLSFYQQVKLVNYIRLRIYNLQCTNCNEGFRTKDELLQHMTKTKHFEVPEIKLWDQPEFYFPTYENDSFLCHLDDNNQDDMDDTSSDTSVQVHSHLRENETERSITL